MSCLSTVLLALLLQFCNYLRNILNEVRVVLYQTYNIIQFLTDNIQGTCSIPFSRSGKLELLWEGCLAQCVVPSFDQKQCSHDFFSNLANKIEMLVFLNEISAK